MNVQEILEAVGGQLARVANADAVIGSPVKLGPATVYPISLVSIGFGGGAGEGENEKPDKGKKGHGPGSGSGGGGGGGAKVRPIAVLVLSPDGVSVLPVPSRKGALERLLEKIPELIDNLKGGSAKA